MEAPNGIVHTIDGLLLPKFVTKHLSSALQETTDLSQFTQLLEDAGAIALPVSLGSEEAEDGSRINERKNGRSALDESNSGRWDEL